MGGTIPRDERREIAAAVSALISVQVLIGLPSSLASGVEERLRKVETTQSEQPTSLIWHLRQSMIMDRNYQPALTRNLRS